MADKYKVGDYYIFGNYMQGPSDTDKTPIEWEILDLRDDKVTLISRYILDVYDGFMDNAWNRVDEEKRYCPFIPDPAYFSDADEWVNGEFRETAFSEEEQKMIDGDVHIPSIDDLKRYYSGRCYELMWYQSYGNNECIGLFGKELIATGTEYALLRGLSSKTFDDIDGLWVENKYLDGYFSTIGEEFDWTEKADAREIVGIETSPWLLDDGCFVDFDTTADGTIRWGNSDTVCDAIIGIRPMIILNVSDTDSFDFKYTYSFINDLSVSLYSKDARVKKHAPADEEEIATCTKELDIRFDATNVLPDDYIGFLRITNGIGENILFGSEKLLEKNTSPKESILLGDFKEYQCDDVYSRKLYYIPSKHKYLSECYSWPSGEIKEFYTFEDFFRFVFKDEIEAGYISV